MRLTTKVVKASPSMSSAMMTSGWPARATFSKTGTKSCHVADLLLVDQNQRVIKTRFHALRVGHEVGRQITFVELHSLDDLDSRAGALALFDGDDAIFADLIHRLGDQFANLAVVTSDGANRRDALFILDRRRDAANLRHDSFNGAVDAFFHAERRRSGGDDAQTFAHDRLRQNGRGRGAVTSDVVGFTGDFFHQFGADVLGGIAQFDLFSDRDAVFGDGRAAIRFLDDTLRPLGPSVVFTASATLLTPRSSARRASSSKRISLAMIVWVSYFVYVSFGGTKTRFQISDFLQTRLEEGASPAKRNGCDTKSRFQRKRGLRPLPIGFAGKHTDWKEASALLSLFLRFFNGEQARFIENQILDAVFFDFGAAVFRVDDDIALFH